MREYELRLNGTRRKVVADGQIGLFGEPSPTPPYVAHSETSRAAADSMSNLTGKLRLAVFTLLQGHPGGLTDQEMQEQLGMGPQTQTARRRELALQKLVVDSGRTRSTRSGRAATVWVAKEGL